MGIFGGGSIVSPVNGYQFERLDQKKKEVYKALAAGIADFQKKIAIFALDDASFRETIEAVILDNPQFFYFDKSLRQEKGGGNQESDRGGGKTYYSESDPSGYECI